MQDLYTRELMELARDHLTPGGVFSVWVNIAYTPEDAMRSLAATAAAAFPYVTIWQSPYLYSWVINGSVEPRPPDGALLAAHFADPKVRADLATIGIREPADFLAYFVMGGDEVAAFAAGAPLVTDDHTRLDFSLPRSVESFYGISYSITNDWLVDLMAPRVARPEVRANVPAQAPRAAPPRQRGGARPRARGAALHLIR